MLSPSITLITSPGRINQAVNTTLREKHIIILSGWLPKFILSFAVITLAPNFYNSFIQTGDNKQLKNNHLSGTT
jgi:hypothetical protein